MGNSDLCPSKRCSYTMRFNSLWEILTCMSHFIRSGSCFNSLWEILTSLHGSTGSNQSFNSLWEILTMWKTYKMPIYRFNSLWEILTGLYLPISDMRKEAGFNSLWEILTLHTFLDSINRKKFQFPMGNSDVAHCSNSDSFSVSIPYGKF